MPIVRLVGDRVPRNKKRFKRCRWSTTDTFVDSLPGIFTVDDMPLGLPYPKPQLGPSVGVFANLTLGNILVDRLLVTNRLRLLHHCAFQAIPRSGRIAAIYFTTHGKATVQPRCEY